MKCTSYDKSKKLRIFVSYGHDEYFAFARNVANELLLQGHEVWFDEDRLKPGCDWESYIEDGLDWVAEDTDRGRILLIMTPHSVRRPNGYCLNEIAKALDNMLTIIPVMLVWTTPPLSIYRLQWLDLTNSANKKCITQTFKHDLKMISEALTMSSKDIVLKSDSLLRTLNPLNYETDIVLNQTWFTGRAWVFEAIDKWINTHNASRLFWITGVPGIGKTAIATRLLQIYPEISAFHICRRGHSEKSSPRRAICTISYQLSTQYPDYAEVIKSINLNEVLRDCNDSALFDILITQPLTQISSTDKSMSIILIDALDEATQDGVNPLADFIAAEFDRLPNWVRLIITSRPDREVTVPLQRFAPWTLDSKTEENQKDIHQYIKKRLEKYNNHKDYQAIFHTIIQKSEGVFLCAKYIVDEILEGRLDINKSDAFPQGLGGVYYQYFTTKFTDSETYDRYIRPAMELIAARYEPLTEDELKSYLGWNNYSVKRFLSCMGSFIVRHADGTLTPFHQSLIDWIGDEQKSGIKFWIDIQQGHEVIASFHQKQSEFSEYALLHLVKHITNCCPHKFTEVFCNRQYIRQRLAMLGAPAFFRLVLEDMCALYATGRNLNDVFSNYELQSIILENHIYFFDHDYYKQFRKYGFNEYISTLDLTNIPVAIACIIICYYYIIYDIKAATEVPLVIPDEKHLRECDNSALNNYRLVYEIKASSYRISGDFERAKQYISVAIKASELLGRSDYLLVLNSVYARIEMHFGDYDSAINRLQSAIKEGNKLISNLSYESDLAKIQHIRTGSTLILIEQYLNIGKPEKAYDYLADMALLYRTPQDYDRYWSRYLYMSALYAIQTKDEAMYEEFRLKLEPFDLNQPGGRLFYHEALHNYVQGYAQNNTELLYKAEQIIKLYIEKAEERYDLELMSEGFALKQCIQKALKQTPDKTPELLAPFSSWISFKRNLFEHIKDS